MLRSSVDPSKLALTIRGLAVAVPAVIVFLGYFGLSVGADDLNALIAVLADIIVAGGALVSLLVTAYGLLRKVWVGLRG